MARRVLLTLLKSKTSQNIRHRLSVGETEYSGVMTIGPSIGKGFTFLRDDGQQMYTTPIKTMRFIKVFADSVIEFDTRNSTYQLVIGNEIAES